MAQTHVLDEEGQMKENHCKVGNRGVREPAGLHEEPQRQEPTFGNASPDAGESWCLKKCKCCGLLQERREGDGGRVAEREEVNPRCGFCEEEMWELQPRVAKVNEVEPTRSRSRAESMVGSTFGLDMKLEDYEDIISGEFRGWWEVMKEMMDAVPEECEEGQRRGHLLGELQERVRCLDEELRGVFQQRCREEEEGCVLAALHVEEKDSEGSSVLHTRTVGLSEVKRDLALWRPSMLAEYDSLVNVTKAVIPTTKKELGQRTDLEYAPGKLVATVKAPDGRRKSRVVVCGNCVESSLDHQQSIEDMGGEVGSQGTSYGTKRKTWDCYAAGIDALTIRAAVRKAGDLFAGTSQVLQQYPYCSSTSHPL